MLSSQKLSDSPKTLRAALGVPNIILWVYHRSKENFIKSRLNFGVGGEGFSTGDVTVCF